MRGAQFRKNISVLLFPILIPVLILGIFSVIITENYIKNNLDKDNNMTLQHTKDSMEGMFSAIDGISKGLNLNTTSIMQLRAFLGNELSYSDARNAKNMFANLINNAANANPEIQGIYLYCNNKKENVFISNLGVVHLRSYNDQAWYDTYRNLKESVHFELRQSKRFAFEESTWMITAYHNFYMIGQNLAQGVIVLNIRQSSIQKNIEKLIKLDHQSIFILNRDLENLVWAGSDNISPTQLRLNEDGTVTVPNQKDYIITTIDSPEYGLKYVLVTAKSELYKLRTILLQTTAAICIITAIIGVLLAYYFSRNNYNLIMGTIDLLALVEQGKPLNQDVIKKINDPKSSEIIHNIAKTFIEHYNIKLQLSEKKYKMKALEMRMLQAQINPHFLSNTLKTIFWKSVDLYGEQSDVSKMIEYLASMFHYSLEMKDQLASLREEIAYGQNYIEIQKIRYKDKFYVIWDYDEAIQDYPVMKMLLQPLLENSIYHGIKESGSNGLIRIKIRRNHQRIQLSVLDNGRGMSPEELEHLHQRLKNRESEDEHIGLLNVYRRLLLIYEEKLYLKIRSRQNLGTVIYLSFPDGGEDKKVR